MAEQNQATDTKGIAYVAAYGAIGRTFEKIIEASTPSRFTQDYVTTKLGIKGGTGKAMLPFLKRTGFLNSDGSPTDQYHQFRNADERGRAAANALKTGYQALYEVNEYAHELPDDKLKGLVVQVTGSAPASSTVKSIIGSFKALKQYADFDAADNPIETPAPTNAPQTPSTSFSQPKAAPKGIQLGYTINLNLPATNDIGVYDAIFKSLKEHLLDR